MLVHSRQKMCCKFSKKYWILMPDHHGSDAHTSTFTVPLLNCILGLAAMGLRGMIGREEKRAMKGLRGHREGQKMGAVNNSG